MKRELFNKLAILLFASAMVFLSFGIANAQIQAAGGGYYVAGYGTVYGSFGQASAAQGRLYDKMKTQNAAASRQTTSSSAKSVVPAPPIVRNYGVFRPDNTVDTGKALADALGGTPDEKALIRKIYAATKTEYDKEAAVRGWKYNISAGLTFFTVTAMTVYHVEEPTDDATNNYFSSVNSSLDEIPEFAKLSNKEKQGYNNTLVGFGGLLVASYTEAKQNNDASALASSKKLAGMLIEMVLKTNPENLRVENGQIVMK